MFDIPPPDIRQYVEATVTALQQSHRLERVTALLLGTSLAAIRQARRDAYKQAIVDDARRRGILDATWHQQWGLYSQAAEQKAATMPKGRTGWPLVWEVCHDWGVGGCGNGFNMQVLDRDLDKVLDGD